MKKDKKDLIFIVVLFVLIIVLVLFFPKIYNIIEKKNLPKVENIDNINKEEKKEITDELLNSIHYPIMRNSIYNKDTYYTLNTFKVSNMSNQDILYNAFKDIEEVKIKNNHFNSDYIELRIKNILGKNIKYTLEDFIVPSDSKSNYKGSWSYNSNDSKFYYKGKSNNINTNTKYYNLEEFIKAEYNKDDILVYKYVGFAKVEGDNYIIYKDANMTKEINKGKFTTVDELNNIFKSINKKDKNIYKYTFKDTLCSYNEYCLYEGKWVNEL